jgi:VWFA-related protein
MRNLPFAAALAATMAFGLGGIQGAAQQPAAPAAQPPDAQQAPPPQPPERPVFRAGVNFVRVDVIVTDKNGASVMDLTQDDFEITEGGRPQEVEAFKRIDLDGGLMPGPDGPPRQIRNEADEETEAARDDVRLFGLFLDDYHVRRGSSLTARNEIARFVETQLGPTDMIGVMYPLTPLDSVRFTRNHESVQRGVQQFVGRKFEYDPKNEAERRYQYYPTETVEKIRNDVSLSAIKALIIHMGGLKEGRKALILVSEGYSGILPPQMRNRCAGCGNGDNPAARDPNAGANSALEDRAAWSASSNMEMDLRDVYDLANRNNVAIYAVDPRGLAASEFDIADNVGMQIDRGYLSSTMETLRTLALQTDGRAIVNRNDLTLAMKQIVRDTSSYYLLGYSSTLGGTDGKFHEIKVSVKRPGVQIRARRGYWAMTVADAARMEAIANPKPGPPKAVETALAVINQPSRMRVIRTWIGTERAADGRTRVTFVWEPVPRAPGDQVRNGGTAARVAVTAVAPDGAPYYRGRVPETAAAPASASALPAQPSRVVFDAQPGKMQLRLSVEGSAAEVLDSEVREITVPDLTAVTALGTPAVFRARTVRDLQQLKSDPNPLPVVAREFSRTERLLVRVPAYGAAGTAPKVSAKLLNRAGQAMSELPVTPSAAGPHSDIEVALAPIPAGEYVIEITAAGDGDAKELVAIRVIG